MQNLERVFGIQILDGAYLEITDVLQVFAFAEQDAGLRGESVAVREAECDVIPVAVQITEVPAQAVKGKPPLDGAGGEGRQSLLQKRCAASKSSRTSAGLVSSMYSKTLIRPTAYMIVGVCWS